MAVKMSAPTAKAADIFDEDLFETRLESLKDTQEGIQQMSSWCLQQRVHHKKIVACWLNVFKRVRVEHRLILFYLANDVIQYSKRKRYEFVESWATALQRATTMVRDEKVKSKVLRIFSIWEQREIYSEEYLSDLSGLLNINPPKKAQAHVIDSSDDFQNATLIANVRECVNLAQATDNSFKKLPKAPNCDIESIKQQLKDKSHSEDVEREIERYITYAEAYSKHLQAEIKSRKSVLTGLDTAVKFYANQRGEVKVVVSAYKNFGSRIKLVKKKLDEITPNLPSPIPSPDINAPSPEPDADLQLPDEQSPISVNLFKSNINGYSSYLDSGKLPFDINDFKRDDGVSVKSSHPIEVIGSRSDDDSFNSSTDFYKPESISTYTSGGGVAIPGLNPMPVPPVESGYTSLARSAQQYGGLLPPPSAALFGSNHHSYGAGYNADGSPYTGGRVSGNGSMQPLMPPPPMPSLLGTGGGSGGGGGGGGGGAGSSTPSSNSGDDFSANWNLNMSWSGMESSANVSAVMPYTRNSVDTPVSPPHFDREANSANNAPIEYTEHNSSLGATQDVDHRQLHLPPLALSKEKTRQLDIDHRNLISLTGSPGAGDGEKKSWLLSEDQDYRTNSAGDVDYRAIQKMNAEDIGATSPATHGLMAPPQLSSLKKSNSPIKSNASSSSESQKEDTSGSGTRYDPTDMVVDMDMSDEDLDDILREVNEQQQDPLDNSQASTASEDAVHDTSKDTVHEENVGGSAQRPALLDTPPEYVPQNVWEGTAMTPMDMPGGYGQDMDMELPHQQQQPQQHPQVWNQQVPWNNGPGGGGGGDGRDGNGMCVPPPPRPPFPLQFPYPNTEYRGGRSWAHLPQQNHRNYTRPPRGSPYFQRGGRGGGGGGMGMRGSFRGKFRGNHAWI